MHWQAMSYSIVNSKANAQLLELLLIDFARCFGHQVGRLLGFGEGNGVADVFQLAKQHDQSVDAQSDSAMRWSAILEGFQQETKLSTGSLLINAQQPE